MFKRTQPNSHLPFAASIPIQSVIGKGMSLRGEIVTDSGTRIDGAFEGSLVVRGPLVIGEGARVVANVSAEVVSVAGSIKGNINAKKVDIRSTGRVYGDMVTESFTAEEGSILRGQVQMKEAPVAGGAQDNQIQLLSSVTQ